MPAFGVMFGTNSLGKGGDGLIFNFRPGTSGNLARFSTAKAGMGSGTRPLVVYLGDSKTMGENIFGGFSYANCQAVNLTNKIADLCVSGGLQTNKDIAFSQLGMSTIAIQASYDPRMVANTNWGYYTDTGISGNTWRCLNPNTNPLSYTFAGTTDRVKIWYIQRTANQDTIAVYDGATLLGTQPTVGGASALASKTFNLASRASGKTISIQRTNTIAQTVSIQGIIAWDSTVPAIDLINLGRSGSKASFEWVSAAAAWSPINGIKTLNADLYVINLGSNDLAASVSVATFTSSMQTIIDACKFNGGNVVLVNPTKGQQPTYGDAAAQAAYSAAIRALAVTNDCPMIDEGRDFGDWANVSSTLFSDSIHENEAGTARRAALHSQLLLAA